MRISDSYMLTHDIDWFCCVDRRLLLHFASNGSIIPALAAERYQLQRAQQAVIEMPFMEGIELQHNWRYIEELRGLIDFDENRYLESFRFFASKGFYSFDFEWNRRDYASRMDDNIGEYKLIVGPRNSSIPFRTKILMNHLPQVIMRDLNDRDRYMFEEMLDQIRRME